MISSEYYMLIYLNFATKNTITQKSTQQTTFSYLYQSIHLNTFLSHQKRKKGEKERKKLTKQSSSIVKIYFLLEIRKTKERQAESL